jgi:O-antigen ligase
MLATMTTSAIRARPHPPPPGTPPPGRHRADETSPRAGVTSTARFPRLVVLAAIVCTLASFVSRVEFRVEPVGLSLPLSGFTLRPEHLCTALLLVAVAATPVRGRLFEQATRLPAMLLAGFIGWNVLTSVFFAPHFARSLTILGWLLLDYCLFVALSGLPEVRWAVLTTGFLVTAGSAIVSILTYLAWVRTGQHFGMTTTEVPGQYVVRLAATEPNILGTLFVLWGLLALFVARQSARFRWLLRLTAVLALTASFTTGTRAAIVALLAGLTIYLLTLPVLRRVAVAVSAVLAAAAVFAVGFPELSGIDRFLGTSSLVDFRTGTGASRVDTWRVAHGDLNPLGWLLGLGTNSFGQRHLEPTLHDGTPRYIGDLPLQVLYDGGIVAVLLLAGVVAALVVRNGRRRLDLVAALLVAFLIAATATSSLWFSLVWIFASLWAMPSPLPSPAPSDHRLTPLAAAFAYTRN